jgi:hypothetical protein
LGDTLLINCKEPIVSLGTIVTNGAGVTKPLKTNISLSAGVPLVGVQFVGIAHEPDDMLFQT